MKPETVRLFKYLRDSHPPRQYKQERITQARQWKLARNKYGNRLFTKLLISDEV
jgi:hypothetical protein